MARREADREDLMREATALRERVELAVPHEAEPVVAGFRADGRLSLYFGQDPAYHFDAEGGLRRAFRDGELYRSQGTTLARLRRQRTPESTDLARHDLAPDELDAFLQQMQARLRTLLEALQSGRVRIVARIPPDSDLLARLIEAIPRANRGRLSKALRK
jgi:hypothetical protein